MRTTLDIDDDVLLAVKDIASSRGTSAGKVLSEAARIGLKPQGRQIRRGRVPILPKPPVGTKLLTMADVNRQRDGD
jgi:hypothetical protein